MGGARVTSLELKVPMALWDGTWKNERLIDYITRTTIFKVVVIVKNFDR